MSTTDGAQETPEVETYDDAAEQAAFDAARHGESPPATEPVETGEVVPESKPAGEPEASAATGDPEQQPEPKPLTHEQYAALEGQVKDLQKQLRDSGGRYGALKQSIDDLQKKLTAPGAAETSAADKTKLMDELMAEIGDFPELRNAFEKLVALRSSGPSQEDLDKVIAERAKGVLEEERRTDLESGMTYLQEAHPDFAALRDNPPPEYTAWLESLRPTIRTRFLTSKDPYHVAEKLDDYREWKQQQATEAAAKAEQGSAAERNSKNRLEAALTPTSGHRPASSAAAVSEQEAFDAARAEARRVRKRA